MILYGDIEDLTSAHYAYLMIPDKEYNKPLLERQFIVRWIPIAYASFCHETMHVLQGLCRIQDAAQYALSAEHDASVIEDSSGFIISKRLSLQNNPDFPPGIAEYHATRGLELAMWEYKEIPEACIPDYEEYQRHFGVWFPPCMEAKDEHAEELSTLFPYIQIGWFTEDPHVLKHILSLMMDDRAGDVWSKAEQTRARMEEMISRRLIPNPVRRLQSLLEPIPDAGARIRLAIFG